MKDDYIVRRIKNDELRDLLNLYKHLYIEDPELEDGKSLQDL